MNEQLRQLIETRRQWVDTVGSIFEEKEQETPGRVYGLPRESIYAGVDEEVQAFLSTPLVRTPPAAVPSQTTNLGTSALPPAVNGLRNGMRHSHKGLSNGSHKGKERARGDAMDIG